MAYDGELDIPGLIHGFSDIGDKGDLLWRGHRQHALCLFMLAHFLLAPSCGRANIRLIKVAQCVKEGKSCIGLALAETLVGLDVFHQRETTWFAGSPLLLQVLFPTLSYSCFLISLGTHSLFLSQAPLLLFLSTHIFLFFNLSYFSFLPKCG